MITVGLVVSLLSIGLLTCGAHALGPIVKLLLRKRSRTPILINAEVSHEHVVDYRTAPRKVLRCPCCREELGYECGGAQPMGADEPGGNKPSSARHAPWCITEHAHGVDEAECMACKLPGVTRDELRAGYVVEINGGEKVFLKDEELERIFCGRARFRP